MKNWLEKVCAAFCLLGAVAVAPACGDDAKQCEGDQTYATYGDVTDCFDSCDAGMCSAGSKCLNGLCVPESTGTNNTNNPPGTNNTTNPPGTNNTTNPPNNTTNPPNNTTNPPTPPTAEAIALCEKYADLLYGSCLSSCTLEADLQSVLNDASDSLLDGDGTAQNPGCAQALTDNPALLQEFNTTLANATCEDFGYLHCGRWGLMDDCGSCTPPTNLGAECTDNTTCDGGSLAGVCAGPEGGPGECVAVECPAFSNLDAGFRWPTDICGTNGVCQQFVPDDGSPEFGACIKGCASDSECSSGACQIEDIVIFEGEAPALVRLCGAECGSNEECGDGARCTSTGSCQFECDGALMDPNEPSLGTWEQLCTSNGGTCTLDTGLGAEFCVL